VFSSDGVFSSEVTTELERLRAAVDTFLDFLGVTLGAREWEERLWNVCRRVLNSIESGVRRGVGVALAMVDVSWRQTSLESVASLRGRSCATTRTW
jgi:hypothetical protein